ncbi:hypothetical protein BpHYR1_012651 [Brachionus plicatilis]|uniref:Uncharacterized protein n=1 Tax=Brachionus plicatilis TaxID=10195 RepID=A0A3M7SUT1_BRAPC|nr:hypothetical protein BpHYR1_012651 [Brachionus plicatilis]
MNFQYKNKFEIFKLILKYSVFFLDKNTDPLFKLALFFQAKCFLIRFKKQLDKLELEALLNLLYSSMVLVLTAMSKIIMKIDRKSSNLFKRINFIYQITIDLASYFLNNIDQFNFNVSRADISLYCEHGDVTYREI